MTRFWSLMSSLDIILPHFYRFFVKVRQDKYIVNSDNVNHFGKNILFAGELLMENGQWKMENRADALVFTESGGILHYIYGSPERNWEDQLSFSGAAASAPAFMRGLAKIGLAKPIFDWGSSYSAPPAPPAPSGHPPRKHGGGKLVLCT